MDTTDVVCANCGLTYSSLSGTTTTCMECRPTGTARSQRSARGHSKVVAKTQFTRQDRGRALPSKRKQSRTSVAAQSSQAAPSGNKRPTTTKQHAVAQKHPPKRRKAAPPIERTGEVSFLTDVCYATPLDRETSPVRSCQVRCHQNWSWYRPPVRHQRPASRSSPVACKRPRPTGTAVSPSVHRRCVCSCIQFAVFTGCVVPVRSLFNQGDGVVNTSAGARPAELVRTCSTCAQAWPGTKG
jgi:hypothetical protein